MFVKSIRFKQVCQPLLSLIVANAINEAFLEPFYHFATQNKLQVE